MAIVRQASFAGGEIAPSLYGRTDVAKYSTALKRMRNFFASHTGAAVSRPGTTYCAPCKYNDYVRLIPFVYSDSVSFVLEFGYGLGSGYVRFYQNGAQVLNGGPPLEVTGLPYLAADLAKLKYAQQGAVLYLTHPSYPPATLTYNGGISWTYAAISFDRPQPTVATFGVGTPTPQIGVFIPEPPTGGSGSEPAKEWTYQVTEIRRNAKGLAYETAPVTVGFGFPFGNKMSTVLTYRPGTVIFSDGSDGGTNLHWYTCILQALNKPPSNATYWTDNGLVRPGFALGSVQYDQPTLWPTIPVYPDKPVVLQFGAFGNTDAPFGNDPTFLGFRVYRGQGLIVGWVGDVTIPNGLTAFDPVTFTDTGQLPDFTRSPPQGANAFKVSGGAAENPTCVTLFDGRLVFANTPSRPQYFWGSAVNDYYNFDTHVIPVASDSVAFEIASRKLEEIRSALALGEKLVLFTQSSVWAVSGANNGPLAFNSISAKRQGEYGASQLAPLVIDATALYARAKGTGVRALTYSFAQQSFANQDLSVYASHLFINHKVVDWCYAEDPWGLVLAVRDDGLLLALTFSPEQEQLSWGWWDTQSPSFPQTVFVGDAEVDGTALILNVCSVPEGNEDAVYIVVNRTGVPQVERFASRVLGCIPGTAAQPWPICLDASLVYNGPPTSTVPGLTWLANRTVWALVDGAVDGPLAVSNAGVVTLTNPGSYVVVGLLYTPQLQLLDAYAGAAELKTTQKTVTRIGVDIDNTRGLSSGPDFDNLREWQQRQASDVFVPALESDEDLEWLDSKWDLGGDVCIQQNSPLPLTVLGVTREVQLGDSQG